MRVRRYHRFPMQGSGNVASQVLRIMPGANIRAIQESVVSSKYREAVGESVVVTKNWGNFLVLTFHDTDKLFDLVVHNP